MTSILNHDLKRFRQERTKSFYLDVLDGKIKTLPQAYFYRNLRENCILHGLLQRRYCRNCKRSVDMYYLIPLGEDYNMELAQALLERLLPDNGLSQVLNFDSYMDLVSQLFSDDGAFDFKPKEGLKGNGYIYSIGPYGERMDCPICGGDLQNLDCGRGRSCFDKGKPIHFKR